MEINFYFRTKLSNFRIKSPWIGGKHEEAKSQSWTCKWKHQKPREKHQATCSNFTPCAISTALTTRVILLFPSPSQTLIERPM